MADKYNIIDSIKSNLEIISNISGKFLANDSDFGFSFSNRKQEIERIIKSSSFLVDDKGNGLLLLKSRSEKLLVTIDETIRNMLVSLINMRNFLEENIEEYKKDRRNGYSSTSFGYERDEILEIFDSNYNDFDSYLQPVINEIRANYEIADLGTINEISAVSTFENLYERRIIEHREASEWWMVALTFVLFILMLVVHEQLENFDGTKKLYIDSYNFFEHLSLRLILLTMFGFIIHFIAKAYRLNKNQQLIYEDKHTALKSYSYFEKSNRKDQDLHRLILLQVTSEIFENKPNGYTDNSKDLSMNSFNNIKEAVDLFKNLKDSIKKDDQTS